METDVLIIGGGLGGVAAALTAAKLGHRVVLTEATSWLGGQLTSQLVPPDEHPWIEEYAAPGYAELRRRIRDYYRRNYPLRPQVKARPLLHPLPPQLPAAPAGQGRPAPRPGPRCREQVLPRTARRGRGHRRTARTVESFRSDQHLPRA